MLLQRQRVCLSWIAIALGSCGLAIAEQPAETGTPGFKQIEEERNTAYAQELEKWLGDYLVSQYPERAALSWNRDYSSIAAYQSSVERNRDGWRRVVKPPELSKTGPVKRTAHPPLADLAAEWLTVPLGGLAAEGILAVPPVASREKPVPLVIVQHGIGSFPERNFGLMDESDAYHSYARRLVESGFAVLTPFNLRSVERRNRIERLCRLADMSLPGIELVRTQRLLDEVLADPRLDAERVGMWGLSLGGLATMFWTPLEPRIKAAVVAGWFNHRRNKMVIPDRRYSCFLETQEEHAFFSGWLTAYTDADVASLICPRPLLIQTGKQDRIAWWPLVVEEFEAAREHYRRLGIAERLEMDLQEGGHEAHVASGLRFLTKWLKETTPETITPKASKRSVP